MTTLWVPEDIDISLDSSHAISLLNNDERGLVASILAAFIRSAGNENALNCLYNQINISEVRFFYGYQVMM